MKRGKLLTLLGSICLVLVLAALLLPACAKEEAPVAPPPAPPPVEKPPVEKPPVEKPVKPIVWKWANYGTAGSFAGIGQVLFLDELEKRCEGRLKIQRFWGQSLCPGKEQPDALKVRLADISHFVPAYYPSKMPLYNMGYLPCLLPFTIVKGDKEKISRYINIQTDWLKIPPLKEEFAQWNGLLLTGYYPFSYIIMGKVRIATFGDLKGKRIRAMGLTGEVLKRAGAAPVFTVLPEIYDALSKGVVDAVCHDCGGFYSYRVYEVSEYFTPNITLGNMPTALVVNREAYAELPEDIKEIIEEISENFPDACGERYEVEGAKVMEIINKAGVEEVKFRAEDNEKLREISREIWKESVDKLEGQGLPAREVFNSLQDIMKKHVPGYEPYRLK